MEEGGACNLTQAPNFAGCRRLRILTQGQTSSEGRGKWRVGFWYIPFTSNMRIEQDPPELDAGLQSKFEL